FAIARVGDGHPAVRAGCAGRVAAIAARRNPHHAQTRAGRVRPRQAVNDHRELVVQPPAQPTVALALGTGGARGLAHIGAIEAVVAAGYRITAVFGGIYAAGKLDVYRDWVCALQKMDVLKLVDWTLSGAGLIKGDRIIDVL